MGQSEIGIFFEGLAKELNGPIERIERPLVPVIAALEIEQKGLAVVSVGFCELTLFLVSQRTAQLAAPFLGNGLGNRLHSRVLAIETSHPKSPRAAHVRQLDANRETILARGKLAGKNGLDVELPGDFAQIDCFQAFLVANGGGKRPDGKP